MKNDDSEKRRELEIIKKNDNYMLTANGIFIITLVLSVLFCIVTSIVFFVNHAILAGFVVLIVSAIGAFIAYILFKLFLSFLCDVKMIRNKLYNIDNTVIYEYYNSKTSETPESVENKTEEQKEDNTDKTQE